MKARALPTRARRSTRGRGRRINRRPGTPVASVAHVLLRGGLGLQPGAETSPTAPPDSAEQPSIESADETLYQLGDGSNAATIDVRADVAAAEPRP